MHYDDILFTDGPLPGPESHASYCDSLENRWTIGEMAREFSVTERALRFYESKNLLRPRRDGTVRLYGLLERRQLAVILKAKQLGFTLAEIRRHLPDWTLEPEPMGLCLSRRQCVEQINLLEARRREIDAALAELRRAYSQSYVRRMATWTDAA